MSFARALATASMLAFVLAGCGVRGSLDAPESSDTATASAQSGQGKPANATTKPHKPFILDGLLR